MGDQSRPEPERTIPTLVFVVLGLMALALIAEVTTEPYPSITMPGFHQTAAIADPADVGIRHLRIEYPGRTVTLAASDLFPTAPVGQRGRMVKRLDQLSGSPEEWKWIDSLGPQPDKLPRADAAELVLISGSGLERKLLRVERAS